MESIGYIKLYNYLRSVENMSQLETARTIRRIRKVSPELLAVLIKNINGVHTNVSVHDVSFDELVENENFSVSRAILFLDWLQRDPHSALHYMAIERYHAPMDILEEDASVIGQQLPKSNELKPEDESDINA